MAVIRYTHVLASNYASPIRIEIGANSKCHSSAWDGENRQVDILSDEFQATLDGLGIPSQSEASFKKYDLRTNVRSE